MNGLSITERVGRNRENRRDCDGRVEKRQDTAGD